VNIYGHTYQQRREIQRQANKISALWLSPRGKLYGLGEIEVKAAREYASHNEYKGDPGGWIRRTASDRVITQGWRNFFLARTRMILDWYTQRLTAFPSFAAMIDAPSTYRPTLMQTSTDWRCWLLAFHYDQTMAYRGDPRRVYRG
jgi:hypothetical protein